ncbi:hypothetical protein CRG98_049083, partial [Punica granatum]
MTPEQESSREVPEGDDACAKKWSGTYPKGTGPCAEKLSERTRR